MEHILPQILLMLATVVFAPAVFLHLTHKNSSAVALYILQSAAIACLLVLATFEQFSPLLALAILSTIAVKLVIAPYFFFRLIRHHQLRFSVSTYLNAPLTLAVIAMLVALVQTDFFKPLVRLAPSGQTPLLITSIATILISMFLMINRKGALSQMLGILSLENGIVAFALFAGLEQNPALQLGITFNILIWIVIASLFAAMIFRQHGSLDVTTMKELHD
ncbi:MAG TPA: NADH-quinone oxidoreductase subunit K [bacterium]|jgi:hydrogenase-4 component E